MMPNKEVTVLKKGGIQNKDAAYLVQRAMRYESEITFEQKFKKINAKSIMGVISLALKEGDKVIINANGSDAEEAIKDISAILESE
ncbi:MAG TPA: HPr family phosphocarrier protein [Clostridia bacterium]